MALSYPLPLMMAAASPFIPGVPTSPPILDPMVALSRWLAAPINASSLWKASLWMAGSDFSSPFQFNDVCGIECSTSCCSAQSSNRRWEVTCSGLLCYWPIWFTLVNLSIIVSHSWPREQARFFHNSRWLCRCRCSSWCIQDECTAHCYSPRHSFPPSQDSLHRHNLLITTGHHWLSYLYWLLQHHHYLPW